METKNHVLRIGGVTDMSTIDWYGNVSMVVFFAGCNIRCPYCQNSGLLESDSGTEVTFDYLKDRIETNMAPVPQLDAVVFTGGEPLLQPDAVIDAAKIVKKNKLKLMLDTNGTLTNNFEKVISTGLIDRVALDVKAPINPEDYGIVTGKPAMGAILSENIKKTLQILKEADVEVEIRTTVAPGLSDRPDFIRRIVKDILGIGDVYYLQQFDNMGEVLNPELKKTDPPTKDHMVTLAKAALDEGFKKVFIKTRFDGLERIE